MKKEFRWQIYFFHIDSKQQHKNREKNIKLTAIYEKQDKSKKNNNNNNRNNFQTIFLFPTNGTQNDYIVSYLIFLNFLPMLYKTTLAWKQIKTEYVVLMRNKDMFSRKFKLPPLRTKIFKGVAKGCPRCHVIPSLSREIDKL